MTAKEGNKVGEALLQSLDNPGPEVEKILAQRKAERRAAMTLEALKMEGTVRGLPATAWQHLERGERLAWVVELDRDTEGDFWEQATNEAALPVIEADQFKKRLSQDDSPGPLLARPDPLLSGSPLLPPLASARLNAMELLWLLRGFKQVVAISWDGGYRAHGVGVPKKEGT